MLCGGHEEIFILFITEHLRPLPNFVEFPELRLILLSIVEAESGNYLLCQIPLQLSR